MSSLGGDGDPCDGAGMTTASQALRAGTAADHDAVDAAFGRFDLTDEASYRTLLRAHATALVPAEAALPGDLDAPWRPRAPLILADLDALGEPAPAPLPFAPAANEAAAWGLLYVLEGSRLGNAYLVRSVPAALPSSYMAAKHLPGEWRALLARLDEAGDRGGSEWIDRALAGARTGFALYRRAAGYADRSRLLADSGR